MVTPSSAVTFTLNVFSPSASATWKSSSTVSASASAVSVASRTAWAALTSLLSGVMVISSKVQATDAV